MVKPAARFETVEVTADDQGLVYQSRGFKDPYEHSRIEAQRPPNRNPELRREPKSKRLG